MCLLQRPNKHRSNFSWIMKVQSGGIDADFIPFFPYPHSGRITAIRSPPSRIATAYTPSHQALCITLSTPGHIFATATCTLVLMGRFFLLWESISTPFGNTILYLPMNGGHCAPRDSNALPFHRNCTCSNANILKANIFSQTRVSLRLSE